MTPVAPLSITRFHGRNKENWENKGGAEAGKFSYLYNEAELKEWLPGIKVMAGEAEKLHIISKNKHADFPVENAAMMQKLLGLT